MRRANRRLTCLLWLAVLLACAGAPAARASGVVTNCSNDTQLRAAVSGGGLVTFACSGTISTSGFSITSNTTIDATGQKVVLAGGGESQVLVVQPFVTLALNNLTIQNGGSSANGAIVNDAGTVTITNSTFDNNSAGAGGAITNSGIIIITSSTFAGNTASSYGGAIYNLGGAAIITNSTFSGNTAPPSEGTIYNNGGTVTLEDTILAASGSGGNCAGGVSDKGYNLSDDSSCGFTATGSQNSVTNLNLGSLADNGGSTQTIAPGAGSPAIGAIPAGTNGCATTITTDQRGTARPGDTNGNCSIGACESVSPVAATITKCTDDSQLQSAVAKGGRIVFACSGIISTSGLLISSDTTIDATGQQVAIDGGGQVEVFDNTGGVLTLNNLTVQHAESQDGAIFSNVKLIITNSTLLNNTGTFSGGITNNQTLIIANSTFSGNIGGIGGAILNDGTLIVANSTFYGNTASFGGAFENYGASIIANSTFYGNTAEEDNGGAIDNNRGTVALENTILAGSGSGGNCAEYAVTDGGYNLADDDSCGFRATGSQNSVTAANLNLGALSYNGGPALTIPLNTGSVALGAIPFGSSGCGAISTNVNAMVLTDERGVFRPQLTGAGALACDIGAVQSTQNQIPVTFNTEPPDLAYSIGPPSYGGQQTLTLPIDTQTTIWTPSPQAASGGTEYVWQGWSDGATQAHVITILPPASGNLSYTANFNAYFLLTTGVNPGGAGTVSVSASAEGNNGYYPLGTQITLTANANSGYAFKDWNGSATATNPLQITLRGPITETAYFSPYTNETGSVSVTESTGLLYSALLANPISPGSPGGGSTVFTVKNTGGSTINGPIQLVLTNLPPGVTGANSSGTFNGNPYWTASMAALSSGASAQVTVQLNYAATTAVSTTPAVYSGSL
ncbi:MAG TPA: choice-of-anchor Q domain-containing protein [Bryobacteraceae bacterium]|nr:choice-of-anchor Q domain-containing protein [Bryobacteraceae bacterium]